MFKKYLHIQPAGIQLAIFLFLWATFFFLFSFLQPFLIKALWGLPKLPDDYETGLLNHPQTLIYLNAVFAVLIFLLPAFLFAYLAAPRPFAYAGLQKPLKSSQWLWVVVLALGLVPILTSVGGWIKELDLGKTARAMAESRDAVFNAYFKSGDTLDLFRNLFFLALLPAFSEELFFRGIVQKFAYTWFKKPWAAILFSGAFFALMHFTVYEFLPILFAGVVLAWVYYITSSLWLSVLVHFLNNGLQVILIFFAARFPVLAQIDQSRMWVTGIFIVAVALFLWALKNLQQLQTPLPRNWSVEELPLSS